MFGVNVHTEGSPFLSHEKKEIIEIDQTSENQTEEHYGIAGRTNDDAHHHWPQAQSQIRDSCERPNDWTSRRIYTIKSVGQ